MLDLAHMMMTSVPTTSFRITRRQSRRMSNRVSSENRGLVKLDFYHLPLYGRFQEKLSISNSLARIRSVGTPGEVILLFGKSGTGKTALVQEALQDFKETRFLGRGKFEQSNLSNNPFAAIVAVFAELVESMIDQMGKDGEDYASRVSDALGDEAYRVTKLIPELVDLIGERPPNVDQEHTTCDYTTFRRLLNLLRYTLRSICSYQKPVVLWFDDLHLADPDSLAIFKYLSNDPEATNLLVIASFEDHAHEAMGKVSTILEAIDQAKTTMIRLENLPQQSINHMISDVMDMDAKLTKKLARGVYKQTKGNAFFVIQFLELIQELGLLQFDVETQQWRWDLKIIKEATSILKKVEDSSDKANYAVSGRLSHLPYTSKMVLSTAALLGQSNFDIKVMAWLLKDKKLTNENAPEKGSCRSLEKATSFMSAMMSSLRGFECNGDPENDIRDTLVALEKIGMVEQLNKNQYRFPHDSIQQGAYFLLPEESNRHTKHWKIGQYLKQLLDKRMLEDDSQFFIMIDQLNRGSVCAIDEEERLELSSLNLRAAYKAKERSAFACAAQYAHYGAAYLGESKWDAHRALSLKLENLAAEMALSSGDNESCLDATQEAIQNGQTLDEKTPAYFLQIKGLTQQGQPEEAVNSALYVLGQLGEKFAAAPRVANVVMHLSHLKGVAKGMPDAVLLNMPLITDELKLTTMQLLAFTIHCASDRRVEEHIPVLRCRMFQLAVKYGMCDESALAYTGYGILVATTLKDYDEAYRFGNLGLQLQQLLNYSKYDARVSFEFYGYIHHLKQPIRHSLVPLQQSYKKGLRYGVIEDALMAASMHCSHYLCSGRPLLQLACILKECLSLVKEYKPSLYLSMVPYGQLVQNLMGKAPNNKILNGDVMDLEEIMHNIRSTNDAAAFRSVMCTQFELAFWFEQYTVAHKLLKEIDKQRQDHNFSASFSTRRLLFYDGLVNAALARTTAKPAPHIRGARSCAKKMNKYAQQGAVDCKELSEILEAELLSLSKKATPIEVTRAYQQAIASAVQSGAHQNVALANELAGRYQKSIEEEATAMLFLGQAHLSYTEWNAFEMAQELVQSFPDLEKELNTSYSPKGTRDGQHLHDLSLV